jgi:hypothetical protein
MARLWEMEKEQNLNMMFDSLMMNRLKRNYIMQPGGYQGNNLIKTKDMMFDSLMMNVLRHGHMTQRRRLEGE